MNTSPPRGLLVRTKTPGLLSIPLSRIVFPWGLKASIKFIEVVNPGIMIPFSTWSLIGSFKSSCRDVQDTPGVNEVSRLDEGARAGPVVTYLNSKALRVLHHSRTWCARTQAGDTAMSGALVFGRLTRRHTSGEIQELKA